MDNWWQPCGGESSGIGRSTVSVNMSLLCSASIDSGYRRSSKSCRGESNSAGSPSSSASCQLLSVDTTSHKWVASPYNCLVPPHHLSLLHCSLPIPRSIHPYALTHSLPSPYTSWIPTHSLPIHHCSRPSPITPRFWLLTRSSPLCSHTSPILFPSLLIANP